MCACSHMYVDSENRERDVMKLLPDLLLYILLMIISSIFFSPVFSRSFAKSPEKKKKKPPFFVQAASAAFQMHNCFPLRALLFPGMLISCDDQRDTGIKVLRFKHFVVFILLP